jgi:cyanophycinase
MAAALLAGLVGLVAVNRVGAADAPPPPADEEVVLASPISGTLYIAGGGLIPEEILKEFVATAGGENAHIAVVTTASETADSIEVEPRLRFWGTQRLSALSVIHAPSREVADDPNFAQQFATVTGVWFIGGHQERLTRTYLGTRTEKAIKAVLKRGGVVGGTSAGAAIMSQVMIVGADGPRAIPGEGFGFLPGTIVDQHFLKRNREPRLKHILSSYPRLVGLGIDENMVLVVRGRTLTVKGDAKSKVRIIMTAVGNKTGFEDDLLPGTQADLLALSRAAVARVQPRFSFEDETIEPEVTHGTLIVAGGGDLPEDAAERFVEAAGGPEATIVVVSTANGERLAADHKSVAWIAAAGAKDVHVVHPRTRADADSPALVALVKKAGGVWFTGGRQWRLVDAFEDSAAEKEFHAVLARGGVVGGSGGGASMLADCLVRGSPLTNSQVLCAGYQEGFGFLKGVAIDPFFTKRNRFADMVGLKRTHPHLIGLGIDEDTAVIVKGRNFEIVGSNQVVVHDSREAGEVEKTFKFLYSGDKYDLAARERLGPPRETPDAPLVAHAPTPADGDDPESQPPQACESE